MQTRWCSINSNSLLLMGNNDRLVNRGNVLVGQRTFTEFSVAL